MEKCSKCAKLMEGEEEACPCDSGLCQDCCDCGKDCGCNCQGDGHGESCKE